MLVKFQLDWINWLLKLLKDQVFPDLNRPCASHHWNTSILQIVHRFICCKKLFLQKIKKFMRFIKTNHDFYGKFWITVGVVFLGARHMLPYIADSVAYDGIFYHLFLSRCISIITTIASSYGILSKSQSTWSEHEYIYLPFSFQ